MQMGGAVTTTRARTIESWTPDVVASELRVHGMDAYADKFVKLQIDGATFLSLGESKLAEMGVDKAEDRVVIADLINKIKSSEMNASKDTSRSEMAYAAATPSLPVTLVSPQGEHLCAEAVS